MWRRRRFLAELAAIRDHGRALAAARRAAAAFVHPAPRELWGIATSRRRVWERRPDDADFLEVRVGTGVAGLAAAVHPPVDSGPAYDPASWHAARRLRADLATVDEQPAVVDLRSCGVLEVRGPRAAAAGLVRAMLCQIAVLHAPEDVGIAVDASGPEPWEWAKWLPHTLPTPAGGTPLVAADLDDLVTRLEPVRRQRPDRHLVVLVTRGGGPGPRGAGLPRSLLRSGLTVIVLAGPQDPRPGSAMPGSGPGIGGDTAPTPDRTIRIDHDGQYDMDGPRDVAVPARGRADAAPAALCELIARALAPLRLARAPARATGGPVSVSALLLGADPATADLAARWADGAGASPPAVPVGVDDHGDTVTLALAEPALVTGAAGSGRTELLRTAVLGLAASCPPDRQGVLLVAADGDGLASVRDLPHVAGAVTGLAGDPVLVDRLAALLEHELERRERRGEPHRLLVVVDGLDVLTSVEPKLGELFARLATRGDRVGIGLLVAARTQAAAGLGPLERHLRQRICLRTGTAAESMAVLGVPDAHHLPAVPGAAYLAVEGGAPRRFRSAYAGAPYPPGGWASDGPPVVPFDPLGRLAGDPAATSGRRAEVDVLRDRLTAVGAPVRALWPPPLPSVTTVPDVVGPLTGGPRGYHAYDWPRSGQLALPIGVVDLPADRHGQPATVDFTTSGHLAVTGPPGSGRTGLLHTVLLAGMLTHTPDELQFYGLAGGGALAGYADAPHVSGVVDPADAAASGDLAEELRELVGRREAVLSRLGIADAAGLRSRRAAGELPAGLRAADVLVLVDGWGALPATAAPVLRDVAARGPAVGVHIVATSSRWTDLPPQVTGPDAVRLRLVRPGWGRLDHGERVHLALARGPGPDHPAARVVGDIAAAWSGHRAPPLRPPPSRLTVDALDAMSPAADAGVPVGAGGWPLRPVSIDLAGGDAHLVVYGDARAGKTEFLRVFTRNLAGRRSPWTTRILLVDYRGGLLDAVPTEHLAGYADGPEAAAAYAEQVWERLRHRVPADGTPPRDAVRAGGPDPELYVVVDDYDGLAGTANPLAPLADLVPYGRDVGLHLVLARRVTSAARVAGTDRLAGVLARGAAASLVLSGDPGEGVLAGVPAVPRPPGRGVLLRTGDDDVLIQVATLA